MTLRSRKKKKKVVPKVILLDRIITGGQRLTKYFLEDQVDEEDELDDVLPEAVALLGDVKDDKKVNDDVDKPVEILPVPAAQIGDVKGYEMTNPVDDKKDKKVDPVDQEYL
jgi:hypothetical protein